MNPADSRVAVIGIIIQNLDVVAELNGIIHEYRDIVLGRMGIPYKQKNINIMSIAVDAPTTAISALTGKIGRLKGVTVKTAYAPMPESCASLDSPS